MWKTSKGGASIKANSGLQPGGAGGEDAEAGKVRQRWEGAATLLVAFQNCTFAKPEAKGSFALAFR